MRKTKHAVAILAMALVAFCGTTPVQATLYSIGDGGLQGGWNLNIDGTQIDGGNSLVGGIKLTPTVGQSIITVCTDINGVVYLGSSYNYVAKTFQGQDGLNPKWGYGNTGTGPLITQAQKDAAAAAIQNAAYVFDQHKAVMSGTDNTLKAAVQLAVWEALYDTGNPNGFSFSDLSGRFEGVNGSSTAAGIAWGWLNSDLAGTGTDHLLASAHTLYTGSLLQPVLADGVTPDTSVQEMLTTLTAVPEPATMIAGALLLLPLGASTLRVLRNKRAA
jgi:hypothetical protein